MPSCPFKQTIPADKLFHLLFWSRCLENPQFPQQHLPVCNVTSSCRDTRLAEFTGTHKHGRVLTAARTDRTAGEGEM